MGFQGHQRNSMWNFKALIKSKVLGFLFLALEFPRDLTQFCGISRGKVLLKKKKNPGKEVSKKYVLNSCLYFFWNE